MRKKDGQCEYSEKYDRLFVIEHERVNIKEKFSVTIYL